MKNIVIILFVLALLGGAWFVASGKVPGLAKFGQTKVTEEIVISGSSSVSLVLELFVKPYEAKYPGRKIKFLPGTSTGDGIKGVAEGTLTIGSGSRLMKEEEKKKYPQVENLHFANDAMVLGVNPGVTVDNLTSAQIKDIYAGKITNWNQVGGSDAEIVVLDREEDESTKILLREKILGKDLKVTSRAIELHSLAETNKTIEKTANSIGQTSLGVIRMQQLKIKPLHLDGIVASNETVKNGQYALVRKFGVAINKDSITQAGRDFVDFIFSPTGKKILEDNLFVAIARGK